MMTSTSSEALQNYKRNIWKTEIKKESKKENKESRKPLSGLEKLTFLYSYIYAFRFCSLTDRLTDT